MPYEKSYIFNTKRTVLIIVGIVLALIIAMQSNQLISINSTVNINKEQVTYKADRSIKTWISNFNDIAKGVSAKTNTQLLKN